MSLHLPRLLRGIGVPLICLALFGLAGGHWALLQAIAWAQMVRNYATNAPLVEAIAKTFSGQFPCGMCTKISEEQQKENRGSALAKCGKKAEALVVERCQVLSGPEGRNLSYFNLGQYALIEWCEAPPAPVPKSC